MALTANTLPSIPPHFTLPLDANMQFCSAQNLTATGYLNNTTAVLDLGLGRFTGMLALDLSALDMTSGDEKYQVALLGSNDNAFGNGNVELLALHDFAATAALRLIATICGINPAVPPTNLGGSLMALPFTNFMQGIVYRYAKLYAVLAGTTPSLTATAWISPIEMKV